MLKSVRSLLHKPLTASDGPLGSLVDLYFDDRDWRLRYLVVDPGRPMPRREVLVPAGALVAAAGATLAVSLARAQIERCPEIDEDKPVYLQHDMGAIEAHGDPHLRSSEVVMGCAVHRPQGVHGRVKDLLIDDVRHNVSCIVIDTGLWLPGRRLELAPSEVERIDWVERTVHLRAASAVANAPAV